MASKRGIVISTPFKIHDNGAIEVGENPSAYHLRKYLLYWDIIDYPDNNAISIGASDDIEYLRTAGVAVRTKVVFQGPVSLGVPGAVNPFIKTAEAAYEHHERSSPGTWSLGLLSRDLYFTDGVNKAGVEFELWNILPVPTLDVPLPEILEFKERRRDELVSLQSHIDEIYQKIIGAADIPRERISQFDKLEQSIRDVEKTCSESGIHTVAGSLRRCCAVALPEALTGAAAAATAASQFSWPLSPLTAGLIGGGIIFSLKSITQPRSSQMRSPISYVNSVRKDLGE